MRPLTSLMLAAAAALALVAPVLAATESAAPIQLALFTPAQIVPVERSVGGQRGLQVGVGNVIHQGKIPFLPIVNWSF